MVKGKKAAAVAYRVPQSREEARSMIADFGKAQRELLQIETAMNDDLASIKSEAVARATPIARRADELFKGLQVWSEANRAQLTDNFKTKTVDLGTGVIVWRTNPRKVNTRGKIEDIVARIRAAGERYMVLLRPAWELDKVAMLRNPKLAEEIDGITVASEGETFAVEPFGDEDVAEAAQ